MRTNQLSGALYIDTVVVIIFRYNAKIGQIIWALGLEH